MSKEKSISAFCDEDYLKYARYVVEERAIPSVIDGLKPTQRKVIFVANKVWKTGNEKPLKVFQLGGKVSSDAFYHHGDCLEYDTPILLEDGTYIKIGEWATKFPEKSLRVVAYDEYNSKFVVAEALMPRIGQITDIEYEIELENGELFRCTENHPFLLKDGTWKIAKDLKEEDEIKSFIIEYFKITKITKKKLISPKTFYDITVPGYENFVIGNSKIVVHNSALNLSIIGMAQSFKNSMPLLEEIGQFGSLRSKQAGAPRYIATKLHRNFRMLYKDFELLTPRYEEGNEIEPTYFLPIIPTVLLNGSSGIAVGFATNVLNRNAVDIIDACLNYLSGKKVSELKPWIRGFNGIFNPDLMIPNRWKISGKYEIVNTTTVRITELPPSITYEKYEKHLNSLIEKRILVSYDDNCSDNINYELKFQRVTLAEILKKDRLRAVLKMEEHETENLTVLDEHGKIKIFSSYKDIVRYFVDFRLQYFHKRKEYLVSILESEVALLDNRSRFIKGIIDGTILINRVPKDNIIKQLSDMKFDMLDGSYSYLLSMPIHSLTSEKYDELISILKDKKIELEKALALVPKEMYENDLRALRKTLVKE